MGQGNPKQHKYKLNDSAGLLEIEQRESIQQAQKRPSKHKSNNSMAGTSGWHDRSIKWPVKEGKEQIGEGKAHDQARPSLGKK